MPRVGSSRNKDLGIRQQASGQQHFLLIAAAERADASLWSTPLSARGCEKLGRARSLPPRRMDETEFRSAAENRVFGDAHLHHQSFALAILGQQRDPEPHRFGGRPRMDRFSVQLNRPAKARIEPEQRRSDFAASRAHQSRDAQNFPFPQFERNVLQLFR